MQLSVTEWWNRKRNDLKGRGVAYRFEQEADVCKTMEAAADETAVRDCIAAVADMLAQ